MKSLHSRQIEEEMDLKALCRERNIRYNKLVELKAKKNVDLHTGAAKEKVMFLLKMNPEKQNHRDQSARYVRTSIELIEKGIGTDIVSSLIFVICEFHSS